MSAILTPARLESIKRVCASYKGVPADVLDYTWTVARNDAPHLEVALLPTLLPLLAKSPIPDTPVPIETVLIAPGQVDRHAGWRFRFGYHSRARVAALWLD